MKQKFIEFNEKIKSKLDAISNENISINDELAISAIEEALKASSMGNYPVGAIIADSENNILARSHNHVFYPYFSSMAHAEMCTLNEFEKKNPNADYSNLRMITSLEPCMMCFSRLLLSKIQLIEHVAVDDRHGTVSLISNLPDNYNIFAKNKVYRQLSCHTGVAELAKEVFFEHPLWDDQSFQKHSSEE